MKHRRFLKGKCLDNTKTPPRRSYFKYRDSTALESARAERKLKRNRPTFYKGLEDAAKQLRSNSRFRNAIKKALT